MNELNLDIDGDRKNINMDDVPAKIDRFHATGASVETHVLSGLPGETYEGHLETLRKCFRFGFDDLFVFSTLLLPGSEMEDEQSRIDHGLRTKYRLRQGGYGQYHSEYLNESIKSIDAEEIIRENSKISENEMLALRPLHWLIWYGWNHRYLKPMLDYIYQEHDVNPVDMLLDIIEPANRSNYPKVDKLLSEFSTQAETEWFDSYEDLYKFYNVPENWKDLMDNGFSKVEFRFNAMMILDNELSNELLQLIVDLVNQRFPKSDVASFVPILQAMRIAPDSYLNGEVEQNQQLQISPKIAPYFGSPRNLKDIQASECLLTLNKDLDLQQETRSRLLSYGYHADSVYSVEKTLGALHDPFLYSTNISV